MMYQLLLTQEITFIIRESNFLSEFGLQKVITIHFTWCLFHFYQSIRLEIVEINVQTSTEEIKFSSSFSSPK